MFKEGKLFFLYAETSVHAGSGSDVGIVDLPIQREKHTNYPVIHSSSLKGSLRASVSKESSTEQVLKKLTTNFNKGETIDFKELKDKKAYNENFINTVFGPETTGENAHIGALSVTDAKILLFPVKSAKGTFVWITCPFVLNRFLRDLQTTGKETTFEIKESTTSDQKILLDGNGASKLLVLEEFAFGCKQDSKTNEIAEFLAGKVFPKDDAYNFFKEKLKTNFAILPDDDFKAFVESSTEVIARTKLDDKTKIVSPGALWYEENLPAETVLYSVALASVPLEKSATLKTAEEVLNFAEKIIPSRVQLGGNETIGRGILSLTFWEEKKNV